ncbi:MAG TPA: biotin/lipoyl-containing protein, partial [Polyangiaceae bacterium]|nr:biotin/lipoyl-containing protein [Polyangiaceae bacterium]
MVVGIHVREGQRVEAGQRLGLLEAMKMEISFDAPISGTVVEVCARRGQQVPAGAPLVVIDPASEGADGDKASVMKLRLPDERDPLALLFVDDVQNPLTGPDLVRASHADPALVDEAMQSVREEVLRILLGYDASNERVESLIALLEAPLPRELSRDFLGKLALVRDELVVFADLERLLSRQQSLSPQGELAPSNNTQLRTFVRRMRAAGAGLDESFLGKLKAALRHYGVSSLEHSDLLEIAVLRMFAADAEPELRFRLAGAVLQRLLQLVDAGLDFRGDGRLEAALTQIAALRGQVPDSVSDAAISATYRIFQRPELERAAVATIARVESWFASSTEPPAPPDEVLRELAQAPRRRFLEVESWLSSSSTVRRAIALAAFVRRLYVPRQPAANAPRESGGGLRLDFSDGEVVLARASTPEDVESDARALLERARGERLPRIELIIALPSGEARYSRRNHLMESVQATFSGVAI